MKVVKKHNFEAVSLLTVENGVLEVAIIPAHNQPDWLVPKSLIMSIDAYQERIWTYLWQGQEVAVYHLAPKGERVDKLIVLEGNSDVHRLALQTFGEIGYRQVRISDVRDYTLPDEEIEHMAKYIPSLFAGVDDSDHQLEFLYQAVTLDNEIYIVPDLDIIAHRLVDLDS